MRINTAADDPSGLAISEKLKSQVNGFDQAVSNVQDATNALTVADGALQTATVLLQRIRTLAVNAANDTLSDDDRNNLQTEVSQLLKEVDHISQCTNFNGLSLLDGSHSGSMPQQAASIVISSNAVLAIGGTAAFTPAGPNLLPDSSFSPPAIPVGNTTEGFTRDPDWTWDSRTWPNTSGFYRDNGATPGSIGGVPMPPPPGGGVAAYINGSPPYPAAVNAIITGDATGAFHAVFGQSYTVSIVMAGSTNSTQAEVQFGTSVHQIVTVPPGWATYTFTGTASAFTNLSLGTPFGSLASEYLFVASVSVSETFPRVPAIPGVLIASAVGANANFATTAGGVAGLGGTGTSDGSIKIQVINTGASIAAQETFINSATGAASVSPTLLAPNTTNALFDNVAVSTGNFSPTDVGETGYLKVSQNVPPSIRGAQISVHSGANEGEVINVGLPDVSPSALGISNINLASTFREDPSLTAQDAIGQIDQALSMLTSQRAMLGAVMVRLGDDANNDNVASINLQSAESSIRDVNVSKETIEYTGDQILVQVGTSVLAQSGTNAKDVERLFQ